MKAANTHAYKSGPITPARLTRLISAPWMRPCASAPTWRVTMACAAGPATAHSALIGTPSRNSAPLPATL
ncbi:hypothetical protein NB713_003826 [Xanthomonas sacchari]|nr:hypothetical protein [Xanthomonas sacchari]